MIPEIYNTFVHYLTERETIRLKRVAGEPGPWTEDPILSRYKFTNIRRSDDRTTKWVRLNWYDVNRDQPLEIQAINCMLFRYFGSIEFADALGYQTTWEPGKIIELATQRLRQGKKVFTGAYIITNAGSTDPKQEVVVNQFLTPFRQNVDEVVRLCATNSWQNVCEYLQKLPGIGAFMSKEVALDMMLTPLLEDATDKLTWSPAGPGAIRGLNRLHGRPLQTNTNQRIALDQMKELMGHLAQDVRLHGFMEIGVDYGVTDVQFSLCELDKYLRVQNNEGRPRSGYDWKKAKLL